MTQSECVFPVVNVDTWEELVTEYDGSPLSRPDWLFRGIRDAAFPLDSTLERTLLGRFELSLRFADFWEAALLRDFQRYTYDLEGDRPGEDQVDEWWALMRHHGAPTRLLDWTYSFWIAVFFALEGAEVGDTAAVWAIDPRALRKGTRHLTPKTKQAFRGDTKDAVTLRDLLLDQDELFVRSLNPLKFNRRQALQQGLFLAPGCVTKSFIENLEPMLEQTGPDTGRKIEIHCSQEMLREGLHSLYRMNLTRATLFPGLDGFANSLRSKLLWPDHFNRAQFGSPFEFLNNKDRRPWA